MLSKLMVPASAGWEGQGGGLNKGTVAFACTSVREPGTPPALVPKPNNSAPPCMSPVTLEQLLQRWSSEQVSMSVRPGKGPLRGRSHSPLSYTATTSGFQSHSLWGLLFAAMEPGQLQDPSVRLEPLVPQVGEVTLWPRQRP